MVEVSTVHLSIDVTASCCLKIPAKLVITRSFGLSHLHLPAASGVIIYWVPAGPLIFILKLPVAVPSMYSLILLNSNNSLNINQLNYFNQTIGTG